MVRHRAVAGRPDAGDARAPAPVDQDRVAVAERAPGRRREPRLGGDAGPEHHQVGGHRVAVDRHGQRVAVAFDPAHRRAGAHLDAGRRERRGHRRGRHRGQGGERPAARSPPRSRGAPRARSASAVSSPIGPLPTSTARGRTCGASAASSARADRRSRSTWTPGWWTPGMPGRTGRAPVATTRAPYGTSSPAGQRHPAGGGVDPRHLDAGADVDVARPPELLGRRGDQRVRGPPPRRR